MTSRLSVTPFPPELVWAMVAGVGGNAPVVDMGYLPLSSPSCGVFTSISAVVSSAALWPAPTGVPYSGLYRGPPGLN
jgi:hypothetical protein